MKSNILYDASGTINLGAEVGLAPRWTLDVSGNYNDTPIRNVKYQIEPFRVEQKTDYDKLVLAITTDGSIPPKDVYKRQDKIYATSRTNLDSYFPG